MPPALRRTVPQVKQKKRALKLAWNRYADWLRPPIEPPQIQRIISAAQKERKKIARRNSCCGGRQVTCSGAEASRQRPMPTHRIEGQRPSIPFPFRQRTDHVFLPPKCRAPRTTPQCRQEELSEGARTGWLTVVPLRLLGELGQAHELLPLLHLLRRRITLQRSARIPGSPVSQLPGFPS